MIIVSNHLIGKIPIHPDTVIRVNLAWVKSVEEAKKLLDNSKHDIYLDFPSGRTKPPQPTISLEEAIGLSRHRKVKYFAMSNCENVRDIQEVMLKTPAEFVPKIETKLGVKNMGKMKEIGIKHFMLDKEDLWTDVHCDSKKFNELVNEARTHKGVMELQGVVFI